MAAIFLLDHRLAFVLLAGSLLAAAAPLALAWSRLLPEEPPPFASEPRESSTPFRVAPRERHDLFTILLLIFVTLSYLEQVRRLLQGAVSASVPLFTLIAESRGDWFALSLLAFLVVVPGFAALYSLVRKNSLRIPLALAGLLVLLLWLVKPLLYAAFLGKS